MEENNNIPNNSDFSDIPSLGDAQGLENYLNNQALAAQGLPVQNEPAAQPAAQGQPAPTGNPAPASNPAAITPTAPAAGTPTSGQGGGETITLTREQLANIIASTVRQQQGQAPVSRPQNVSYSPAEQNFIAKALAQGYSLQDINNFLVNRKNNGINPAVENRIAKVEEYLRTQEYRNAESAFINKLSDFGSKWGLSEQDLVTFGNEALKNGINIAMDNVNLEAVFRAVYPEQYAIRAQRMTPTNSSQIYGGTSIPESNRASSAKLEDAYVESFLKGKMPNQYSMLNKK
jgi:hypothetical protein